MTIYRRAETFGDRTAGCVSIGDAANAALMKARLLAEKKRVLTTWSVNHARLQQELLRQAFQPTSA